MAWVRTCLRDRGQLSSAFRRVQVTAPSVHNRSVVPQPYHFFFVEKPKPDCQGEHDQAMAAYCSASRLMPGCHLPLLCVGMEYMQTNNLHMASQHLLSARAVCGSFLVGVFAMISLLLLWCQASDRGRL